MHLIKKIRGLDALRLCVPTVAHAILLVTCLPGDAFAASCLPPPRPFVPSDSEAARDYADLIRSDFELYIRDIQSYFRCLEEERARAFEEAREVSQDYGRFLELMGE
ncbi:hypothetical protein [Phaeobacter gallaeciensis]|uniref:Uncharacterized protein n=1 Tax=Phaeobacter gallaeciensis TaxID=60890 RepID=A0ABD4XE44_9RHOB|nr:hypothetical protein [Phaeobacter gallaeciensis]MDE4142200.1 hypothetical protein [Phaeobacter gallaeciensis]MDE4146604.1 hypothetical protein [Phaeobacter gallaeciensis]MDE4150677.1 hypothetical protein [Phaeobacter gallaeciensis]MDE4154856.1 hypothetical protein [Phaeobacter gallaeciensis]MDE4159254.1 hypothetical protein [Phaeobacter gallaeciensis]